MNGTQPVRTTARHVVRHDARLDTTVSIETPEGVSLALSPAGPVPRAAAWMIDQLLRLMIYGLASLLLTALKSAGSGLLLLIVFVLEWFYPVLFEVLNRGATPGKMAMNLAVVETDGRPVGWQASTVRNFLRTADFLPFMYLAGLLSMLSTRRFQRLGDLAAGTIVVHRNTPISQATAPTQQPAVAALAPTIALTLDEQHALIALVSRQQRLSQERLAELAAIAPALTGNDPQRQRERLLGISRYLAGDRDVAAQTPAPVAATSSRANVTS